MKAKITKEDILNILDKLYLQTSKGIPKVSPPIEEVAKNYLEKKASKNDAAKSFINYQIAKCTTSGFLTSLGGIIVMPVAIPANISSVLYVQMRMIAVMAYMGGYDTDSDQVQTLVYVCLAGISIDQILKKAGIQIGNKLAIAMIKKIPGQVLIKINQKVGFRLLTKFGTKGIINLGKATPIIGGVIGGGFDLIESKAIAKRAYKLFIQNDTSDILAEETETEVPEETTGDALGEDPANL